MSDLPFLILVLLLAALLLRVDFIFYIVYVCLGVYLWSQWFTPRAVQRLTIRRSYRDHAFLGEQVSIEVEIGNNSRFPLPWIQLVESVPVALRGGRELKEALSFRGKESKTLSYSVQAMRRGYYRLGPLLVSGGDLFGFRESQARLEPDYLTVYPEIVPISRLRLPSKLPFGTIASRQRLYEDPARPVSVRQYQVGDTLRHINWKASAHTDSLLVRTFQPAVSLESMILLNLNTTEYPYRQRYDGPEWAIVVAASVAAHLVGQRQAVGLAANGADPLLQSELSDRMGLDFDEESGRLLLDDRLRKQLEDEAAGPSAPYVPGPIYPRPGRVHLMKLLETLARIESGHTVPYHLWALGACVNLSWGVTVLAITPQGDQQTCQMLHRLARSGYNPLLLVIDPYANMRQIRNRATRFGFPAYQIGQRNELGSWPAVSTVGDSVHV